MLTDDEATFRDHAAELTRYAAAINGPSDADDVVADAFASAFASPKWAMVEDRRAYLYQAVLNQVRDQHRSFSGGFGFLLTYDAGTLIRIDQPAASG